ncbi:MAG: polysaccharide deacetylase family protein [Bacteroidota bacterium]
MFFHKTPWFITKLFPGILWHYRRIEKVLYLTFDDGPLPEVTPWVLEQLKRYNAKATFFMVGENIIKHPETYNTVIREGHTVGNHSMNHLNGWETKNDHYFKNIAEMEELIKEQSRSLLRPPYGRIRLSQLKRLSKQYKIVMWDVLSGDFSKSLNKEEILSKSINSTRPGSIIVFHDSLRMFDKVKFVLPQYLAHFHELGYTFKALQ